MVCLGIEPGAAGWKAQTNPMSYGGTPKYISLSIYISLSLSLALWNELLELFRVKTISFKFPSTHVLFNKFQQPLTAEKANWNQGVLTAPRLSSLYWQRLWRSW